MYYVFSPNAWEDYLFWDDNRKIRKKISDLLKDISRNGPIAGIGKPEALSGNLSGFYSRRIDDKNRLIYRVEEDQIIIISCRFHYLDN